MHSRGRSMYSYSGLDQVGSLAATIAQKSLLGSDESKNPPKSGKEKADLATLEDELRRDEITMTAQRTSQFAENGEQPTAQQAAQQRVVQPVNVTFENVENKLGDYSRLVAQFENTNVYNGLAAEAMVLSTLDSRRGIDRVLDDSQDGYSLLSNSFNLVSRSEKNMKKDKKISKLGSMTLHR